MRAIIIDDEQDGVVTLKLMLEKYIPDIRIIGTSNDPEEGIRMVENFRPDVLFLDVNMPGCSGFELLDKLQFRDFFLVFSTAHEKFAMKAIKARAFDYLLKPTDPDDLKAFAEKARSILSAPPKNNTPSARIVEIPVKEGLIFIHSSDIVHIEASGSYSTIFLEKNIRHMVSKNLKECEALFSCPFLFRCHSSHIINLLKVEKLIHKDGVSVLMRDGAIAVVSRNKKDLLVEKLKAL